jgi:hypothetical protein
MLGICVAYVIVGHMLGICVAYVIVGHMLGCIAAASRGAYGVASPVNAGVNCGAAVGCADQAAPVV